MQIIIEAERTRARTKERIDRFTEELIEPILTHDTHRIEALNEALFVVANYLPNRDYIDFLKRMQKLIDRQIKSLEFFN